MDEITFKLQQAALDRQLMIEISEGFCQVAIAHIALHRTTIHRGDYTAPEGIYHATMAPATPSQTGLYGKTDNGERVAGYTYQYGGNLLHKNASPVDGRPKCKIGISEIFYHAGSIPKPEEERLPERKKVSVNHVDNDGHLLGKTFSDADGKLHHELVTVATPPAEIVQEDARSVVERVNGDAPSGKKPWQIFDESIGLMSSATALDMEHSG